jgi:hypothetical protein
MIGNSTIEKGKDKGIDNNIHCSNSLLADYYVEGYLIDIDINIIVINI